jgi:hypothetical protein
MKFLQAICMRLLKMPDGTDTTNLASQTGNGWKSSSKHLKTTNVLNTSPELLKAIKTEMLNQINYSEQPTLMSYGKVYGNIHQHRG